MKGTLNFEKERPVRESYLNLDRLYSRHGQY